MRGIKKVLFSILTVFLLVTHSQKWIESQSHKHKTKPEEGKDKAPGNLK